MTTLTLGTEPADLSVILNVDADFNAGVRRSDNTPWPDGSQLKLIFIFAGTAPAIDWSASYSTATALWSVDKVDVNAVATARPRKVQLWFTEGASDELLAAGTVTVNR